MPDWAPEMIHNVPRLVAVLSLYPASYKVFAGVEDRLSVSVKQEISAWLKSAGDFAAQHTLSFNLLRFHSELFGDKQLSVKCLVRTTLFSLASYVLVFIPHIIDIFKYIPNLPLVTGPFRAITLHDNAYIFYLEIFLLSFILIVLPLDFLGVAVTRKFASITGDNVTLKKVTLIFIFDTLTKTAIFPIFSFIFVFFIMYVVIPNKNVTFNVYGFFRIDFISFFLRSGVVPFYIRLCPALFLCSAWVWLYFVGLRVVRVAIFLFDVDKQPVRSIGIVGAAVLTVSYGLYTVTVGRYTVENLSNRAFLYAVNKHYDQAIADYTEAIRLNPQSALTFDARGFVYAAKEDYDRAIADYNEAIRLNPEFGTAFNNRGFAYAAKEDYDRAIADYYEAIRLNPVFPYPVLWLYLARVQSGSQTAAAELETNAKYLIQSDWPYPVVELFLGHRTPEATLAAATNPDDRCVAKFFVGEWRLSQGDRPAAVAALKETVNTCSKMPFAYEIARGELHRLGQ